MKEETIYFYSVRGDYGFMSNFARYPVKVDGITYKTSEHYFQSMKFQGTKWEKKFEMLEIQWEPLVWVEIENFLCVETGNQLKIM